MSATKSSSFRLNTCQFFLTYPRCSLTPEEVYDCIMEKVTDKNHVIMEYIVAQELHEDGYPHVHAYIKLDVALQIRNEKFFDIDDFHPNIQGCRSNIDVIKYVTKGDTYISNQSKEVLLAQNKARLNKKSTL